MPQEVLFELVLQGPKLGVGGPWWRDLLTEGCLVQVVDRAKDIEQFDQMWAVLGTWPAFQPRSLAGLQPGPEMAVAEGMRCLCDAEIALGDVEGMYLVRVESPVGPGELDEALARC